ncbi:MAG: DUF2298 domain-containing protein, partial [Chloroflexota bacterium]|nr:DUF2298 domain-containing protein [Chloroflexota bacterium]
RHIVDRTWLIALAWAETISLGSFSLFVWLRGFTPDLTFTEKPMDSALLHASALATTMPPLDPWLSGHSINYYYLGYVVHGSIARLAAVPAATAYNLALATTFGMAVTVSAGLTFNALRVHKITTVRGAVGGGALAAFFLAVSGNLYGARRLIVDTAETWRAGWWDAEGIGWRSSRVVCDAARIDGLCTGNLAETINEFPFFSFLLGDLHPHLMALPFVLMALVISLNLFLLPGLTGASLGKDSWLTLAVSGVLVGSLYPLNSWDYPTFLVCALSVVWWGHRTAVTRRRAAISGLLFAGSILAWLPFTLRFVPLTAGDNLVLPEGLRDIPLISRLLTTVGAFPGPRTSVGEYLTVFGVFWFASVALCGHLLWRWERPWLSSTTLRYVSLPLVTLILITLLLPAPVIALAGAPLAAAIFLLAKDRAPAPRTVALALFAAGHGLVLIVEFFYIQDRFGTRMNTVFKVYYQVWVLFAIATALTIAHFWRELGFTRTRATSFGLVVALLALAGAVYPVLATKHWTNDFADWHGLDGTAYLDQAFPDELAAIAWLRANASVDDVVLEAAGCSYENVQGMPVNRISSYTGIPTIVGWAFHEVQWRSGQPALTAEIGPRQEAVRSVYEGNLGAIEAYGVTHIVVGSIERNGVGTCGVAGPYSVTWLDNATAPDGWEIAFAQGDVRVYRILETT